MKFGKEQSSYTSLKKSKSAGLVGVIMFAVSLFLLSGGEVRADEVVDEHSLEIALVATETEETETTEIAEEDFSENVLSTFAEIVDEEAVLETSEVVSQETTATIEQSSVTSNETRASVQITTEVTEPVKAGQFIEYTLENLPAGGLDNKEITIADGTVVGQIVVVEELSSSFYGNSQNNTLPNDSLHDQSLSPESMDGVTVLHVVFNEAAERVVDLTYSFGYTNQYFSHFIATAAYEYATRVKVGGKVVADTVVSVEAYDKTPINRTTVDIQSPYNSVVSAQNGLLLTDGVLAVGLYNSEKQPIEVGDTITVKVDGTALVTLTNQVGDVLSNPSQRGYYDETEVNGNNIILNDRETARFEVVSNDGETLVMKALIALTKTNKYGIFLDVDYTPSADEISADGKKITGIENTDLVITKSSGEVLYTTVNNNKTANIYGNNITADAAFTGKLVVVHQTTEGVVLESETPLKAKEGTSYTTEAKVFDGYQLVSVPENATGKYTKGITLVTYVYEKLPEVKYGSVIEIDKTTSGEVIRTSTVVDNAEVGTAYDTSAQDQTIVTADGRIFELFSKASNSVGEVVEGTTEVVNVYREKLTKTKVVCIPVTYCKTYTIRKCVPVTYHYRDRRGCLRKGVRYEYRTVTRTKYVTEYRQVTREVTYYV